MPRFAALQVERVGLLLAHVRCLDAEVMRRPQRNEREARTSRSLETSSDYSCSGSRAAPRWRPRRPLLPGGGATHPGPPPMRPRS